MHRTQLIFDNCRNSTLTRHINGDHVAEKAEDWISSFYTVGGSRLRNFGDGVMEKRDCYNCSRKARPIPSR